MLEIRSLRKSFGEKVIFSEASLELESGAHLLEAPNGAGKTSLLRMIARTLTPDAGSIIYSGDLGVAAAEEGGFYPRLTIKQNLEFFGALHGLCKRTVAERSGFLRLIDFLDLPFERCSLGMQQKAKLVRALLPNPTILLLDEPFNGVDAESRKQIQEWIKEWASAQDHLAILVQHGWDANLPRITIKEGKLCSS